jgi:hypothetical protein
MKTRTLFIVLVAGLVSISTPTFAQGTRLGVATCGEWIQERARQSILSTAYEFWLLGYLSGVSVALGVRFLPSTNAASIEAWMDNYCRANPLDSVGEGADKLAKELIKRAGR